MCLMSFSDISNIVLRLFILIFYCHSGRSEESADGNRTSAPPSMTLKLFFQQKGLFNLFESSANLHISRVRISCNWFFI